MQLLAIPYDIFTTCIINHPVASKAILHWNQRDLFAIIASFIHLSRTLEDESGFLKDKKSAYCERKFVKTWNSSQTLQSHICRLPLYKRLSPYSRHNLSVINPNE